jgi:hypothetical protein
MHSATQTHRPASPTPSKRKAPTDPAENTKQGRADSPTTTSPQRNPHKNLPHARAAAPNLANSHLVSVAESVLPTSSILQRDVKASRDTPTEVYTEIIIANQGDSDTAQYTTPLSSPNRPQYGPGPIQSPIKKITTPGGSIRLIFANASEAHIEKNVLGSGGTTDVYAATFTSPGQTKYPAAAVYTTHPSQTIFSHPKAFGHLANIHMRDTGYVSLTLKGITLEDAAEKIKDYAVPQKYKLAFLLKHFPDIVEKLSFIEDAGYAHEDVKPSNLVIWGPDQAGPIDMRDLPRTIDRKRTFSIGYYSPGTQLVRKASSSSDIFATGRSISRGLGLFEASFSEIPGLPDLIVDMEKKEAAERPSLATVQTRLETCLHDFEALNSSEYATQISTIQAAFFE